MSWVRVGPARPRMRFSRVEVTQILIAVAAMTVAFTLSFFNGISGLQAVIGDPDGGLALAFVLLASFIAVVTAFLLHELAHKAVAQRYGCFAEFRYFPMGLVLGVITGAFGFLFAMPGAVMISGSVGPREHVRISAAGPGTNLVLAVGFIGLAVGLGASGNRFADFASILVGTVAFVNLFLGGFNLLPFPPLDGSKVFAFSKPVWVAMVLALVAIGYTGWRLGVLVF